MVCRERVLTVYCNEVSLYEEVLNILGAEKGSFEQQCVVVGSKVIWFAVQLNVVQCSEWVQQSTVID